MLYSIHSLSKKIGEYIPEVDTDGFEQVYRLLQESCGALTEKEKQDAMLKETFEIVNILVDCHADQITLKAAFLSRVVLENMLSLKTIEEQVGIEVVRIIEGMMKVSKVQYQEGMGEHEIESLQRMFVVLAQDVRVVLMKLAERLYCMESVALRDGKKYYGMVKESFQVYVPLADLLGIWKIKSRLEDICFQILFPEEYLMLSKQMKKHAKMGEKFIDKTLAKVEKACAKENISLRIEGRMKHLYSIFQKMLKDKKHISDVHDIYALRIITNTPLDCYRVLGIIHSFYRPKSQRFKDYIAAPKANYYQSIHTTVTGEGGTVIEFQIRTEEMHREAEYGISSHFFYKWRQKQVSPWMRDLLHLIRNYHDKKSVYNSLQTQAFKDRILVFTDAGNIIDLPERATVLDFSYHLGLQYGHSFQYAEVNGVKKGINTVLHTGDTVKIYIDPYSCPHREWLNYVVTDFARDQLINFFRQETQEKKMLAGIQILDEELYLRGKKNVDALSRKEKDAICHSLKYASFDEVLIAVGEGILKPDRILYHLMSASPIFFTSTLVSKLKRWFNILRGKTINMLYPVRLKILVEDRFGILKDVAEVFMKHKINLLSLSCRRHSFISHLDIVYLVCEVKNQQECQLLLQSLGAVESVRKVRRLFSQAELWFYTFCLMTIVLWAAHPYFVSSTLDFISGPWRTLLLYGGMGFLIMLMLQVHLVFRRKMVLGQEAKYSWWGLLLANTIAFFIALFEVLFLVSSEMNWMIIFVSILVVYGYLILDYMRLFTYKSYHFHH